MKQPAQNRASPGAHRALRHQGVARSLRFILKNGHKDISVSDIMKVARMSRRGLHKAFLQHMRLPPGRVLRMYRMERARVLLARPDAKVESIATMVGYRSANSFSVAFKHTTGVAPKRYANVNEPRQHTGRLFRA